MSKHFTEISRRAVLAGTATLFAAPMVLGTRRAAAKSDSVTTCNYGGSYQEATVKAVYDPFTKETGIKVNIIPAPGLDRIMASQLTGNVDIDVWLSGSQDTASGSKRGFWESLDPALFDLQDMVIEPKSDYVAFETFAQGIAWDPAKYGQGKHPANYAEFFDMKKFPGRRVIKKGTIALEPALLGDGVSPKDIYPLDLNRAFKALDRIKSNTIWAQTTPQLTSLLQTGEADFGNCYASRVKSTTDSGGVPLAFSFEQNIIDVDCLAIVKGAPNKENAIKLITYYLRPDVQARLYNLIAVTPVSKTAAGMLSPEMRKWQPDPNSPNNLILDGAYWADNFDAVSRRFLEWLMT
ncbi:ABC transporter substrate-binding protein [Bradyrhizobium sp. DASA03005]|uniref:ABC transporter substrate-binding protein n=1 Tax=Bradyrhizobium sp. SPXBL-02 TaxID=3395912 RepID=UPI003F71732E